MKHASRKVAVIFGVAVVLGSLGYLVKGSALLAPSSGTWAPTPGVLSEARSGAAALPDGRVLITGGEGLSGEPLASAEIFGLDGSFTPAAPMSSVRSRHVAVALADGRVLVAGGIVAGSSATGLAEIYDPASGTWQGAGSLQEARAGATATLLADGRVLIAGGEDSGTTSMSLEVFDPVSDSFVPAGVMSSPRKDHAAALLSDGRVFVIAGSDGNVPLASSEVWDPASGQIVAGPALSVPRQGLSATTLLDGTVLIAGGSNGQADLATAEIFDPASGTITPAASALAAPRSGHRAVFLPHNASVLILGGTTAGVPVSGTELYIPWAGGFTSTGQPAVARDLAAASPAADGMLLVAGGKDATGARLDSGEVYGFATVKTDKADYAPGETVTITGGGWEAGDSVQFTLHETNNPNPHPDRVWFVTADASGNLFDNSFYPEAHDSGVRFYLTALGARSQAQTTFTDGSLKVQSGQSGITFTLTASIYSNTTCTDPPTSTSTVTGVNNTSGANFSSVGETQSAKFTAAALSDQGSAFVNWTSSDPATPPLPTTQLTICVAGFQSGNQIYKANYVGNLLSISNAGNVNESDGNAPFTVTLSPASANTVTVGYTTVDGTAVAPGDYTTTSGTLTFTPGQTSKPILVPIIDDVNDENNEDFTVQLSSPTNAGISDNEGSATIVDNDQVPSLSINDVSKNEGNSGTTSFDFTVTLSPASGKTVTVQYATANGTASAPGDYTAIPLSTLTFSPGDTTKTVTVLVNGDTSVEPNETFFVNLSNPGTATVSDSQGQGTILNDDVSNVAPTVARDNASVTVNEGQTAINSGTWSDADAGDTVTLSASVGTVTKIGTNAGGTWSWSYATTDGPAQSLPTVTITADDGQGHTPTTTFSLTVNNVAPTATFNAPASVNEGSPISLSLTSPSDPSSADTTTGFTYAFDCGDGPGYGAFGASTSASCPTTNSGTRTVKGKIKDKDNGVTEYTREVTIKNVPPTVSTPTVSPEPSDEGSSATASATFTDPAGEGDAPFTCTVNYGDGSGNLAGTVSGTTCTGPAHTYGDNGNYTVTVSVTDKDGGTGSNSSAHVVNNLPPTATLSNNGPVDEGSAATVTFSNQTDPSSADIAAGFHYAYACDNASLAAATYAGSGTSASTNCTFDDGPSTPTVRARIIDKDNGYTEYTTVVHVNNVAPKLSNLAVSPATLNEGQTATLTGNITDPGILDTFNLVVNWGDGTAPQTFPLAAGTTSFNVTHLYADDNPTGTPSDVNSISVTVTDKDGGSDSGSTSITVNNVAPTPAITGVPASSPEGTAINLTSAVTDPGTLDTFTHAWSVTKNGSPFGSGGTGSSFSFTPDDNGTYVVSLTVTDDDTGSGSDSKTITVTNVAPTAAITGAPASSPEGTPITLGSLVTDPSSVDTAAGFTYAWSVTKGGNPYASGSGPSLTFTPDDNAMYVASFSATDKDGGTGTDSKTITVFNVAPTPAITGAPPTSVLEGTPVILGGSASDPSPVDTAAGFTLNWSVLKNGSPYASGSSVAFILTPDDNGAYVVTLTATDKDGGFASASVTITATNADPVITSLSGASGPLPVGSTASVTANFTDAGTADTHTCSFSWDDGGSNTSGAVTETNGSGSCTGSRTYLAAGVYSVQVTVTDDDGGSATKVYEFVVIYDPSAGFVTGGGWINTLPGSYVPDVTLGGKATFGFVSKYKKGATAPTGQTEFQFHVAKFNFHSEVYQWLVVAGPKAQYKGTGTVNNAGNYGFLLTATDGQVSGGGGVDKFRIKIWDVATSAIVYDNKMGASDDIDAADPQAIASGSIVVHK